MSTLPSTATFQISAIPTETLRRIREHGIDDLGNPVVPFDDTAGELPLRCCLRDSVVGERVAAIGYGPFPWSGPYAETGPVFIHAEACDGYSDTGSYPAGYRHRQQIFRAYGPDRTIVAAKIVDSVDAEPALAKLLARSDVDFVHSRNVAYGCYMFTIRSSS
ncbi:MAG: DUF1203 domain-containing protein [Sporichthyaceae bacterium]|nr:DUF1203 domain-containing protein [Sporichthyaceae bacterium]